MMGDPHDFAFRCYESGADELFYGEIVASLYGRNNLSGIIKPAAQSARDRGSPVPVVPSEGGRNPEPYSLAERIRMARTHLQGKS